MERFDVAIPMLTEGEPAEGVKMVEAVGVAGGAQYC